MTIFTVQPYNVDETGKKLLQLMFRPGEEVCVSPNQFGYHSVPLEMAMNGPVVLVPTQESLQKRNITFEEGIERIDSSQLLLCALNPIKGYREDSNCTAYRNFLIELDYGPLKDQFNYIKQLDLPYSAAVFSGNKSIHFLVSLQEDLPSEKVYRFFSEYILNIISLADQNTKNPSRSIRIPGAWREPKKKQRLIEIKEKVKLQDLTNWLNGYPNSKPKEKKKRVITDKVDLFKVKKWVRNKLRDGIDISKGRNKEWFIIGCEFCLAGYSEDDTIDALGEFFSPDSDFKEKEWETTVRSAFKYVYHRK